MPPLKLTADILAAALEGFEAQKNCIRRSNGGDQTDAGRRHSASRFNRRRQAPEETERRRSSQDETSTAIAVAEDQSLEQPDAAAAQPKTRKVRAAGRKSIITATKKRWAAVKDAEQAEKPVCG